MTRQEREGSIKWETQVIFSSFLKKYSKRFNKLHFTEKVKTINSYVPKNLNFISKIIF